MLISIKMDAFVQEVLDINMCFCDSDKAYFCREGEARSLTYLCNNCPKAPLLQKK